MTTRASASPGGPQLTYFNKTNAATVARGTAYLLTCPLVAIASLAAAAIPCGCSLLCGQGASATGITYP